MPTERATTSPHTEHARMPTTNSSASLRCTQCNVRSKEKEEEGRNLVVCIDGTSNQFGQNNTNVVKLFAEIDLENTKRKQCAYYSSGIGTRPKSLKIIDRIEKAVTDKFDMAIAWNMEEIVKDAYGWLARIYQEGDQIYLFGFSRGAYQVRVLAGMIHEVGLIRTPTDKQIGTAYDYYEAIRSGKPKTRQIAREFKSTFSWKGVGVHFVGVWDTVSSVGLIRGDVFLSTSSSAAHACHFRHALALDELRVKFIPEYFHEMNSQTDDVKSKYIVTSLDDEGATNPASERRASTVRDSGTHLSEGKRTTEIKEVWFAGSHSDVGGKNRPGKSQQAGNVSLLWMRREAIDGGLVLMPTDIVWVPDDLDFGISNSMSRIWRTIEYLPIKHQVCFSGAGEDARRWHRLQPRRIIPGQRVHASVLYANAYKPQATLGEGFDIPIIHSGLEDMELDSQIWETGLFDNTAAEKLVTYLGSPQGVAPIFLDRLLFMLRFEEGKRCLRNVPQWRSQFRKVIGNSKCVLLVRLVTILAYCEASCDAEAHPENCVLPESDLPPSVLDNAKEWLNKILAEPKHRDCPSVVSLLRPLTKHPALRKRILTKDVLERLVMLFDEIVSRRDGNFGQAMDGLNCLLQYKETREILVEELRINPPSPPSPPNSNVSRLSQILEVNSPHRLIAALRVVLTLARCPNERARTVCSQVKPRIRKLASKHEGLVGLLAVETLLALYDRNDPVRLSIRNAHVRANLSGALVRLNTDTHDSADGQDRSVDRGQQTFRDIFGFGQRELSPQQRKLIGALKTAVQKGNVRERTAATMTLLKLCETTVIRTHLCQIRLLNVFVSQLRRKDSALLAAYALATCLKYDDMKEPIKTNDDLPKNIVYMLKWDYFDDAVGQVEGFQIFGDFMQQDDLREKMRRLDTFEVLYTKLGKGKPEEIRTSLICLEIFRFFDEPDSWTARLVDESLRLLRDRVWETQKAGVTILSALARTKHGVEAIKDSIQEIVGMLLPKDYRPIQPTEQQANPSRPASPNEGQTPPATTITESTNPQSPTSPNASPRTPSWMMGPACALRVLAQDVTLRNCMRETIAYGSLKHLYLSGTLVDKRDTSPWNIGTPNRTDVINMLEKMIKAVDGELSEEGLMSIGDAVLPHFQHWNRLLTMLRDQTVMTILPPLGVSILGVLALVVAPPFYLSVKVYEVFQWLRSRYQDSRMLAGLRGSRATQGERQGEADPRTRVVESASIGHDGGGPLGGHGESSRIMRAPAGGNTLELEVLPRTYDTVDSIVPF